LAGFDPHVWRYSQGILTTWGGGDFNALLKESFVALGYAQVLTADSYGISGFASLPIGTPCDLVPLIEKAVLERKVKLSAANLFREPTAYHRYLGTTLQMEDAYSAIPLDSCRAWLNSCTAILNL
jgi:hypothetical protein